MPGHLVRGHRAAGRYRLEAPLGSGDGHPPWRAVDETLERQVAVRFFDPGTDRTVLMERAALAASLTHPRVVRVFDSGFDAGQFFTVTELVPGSLAWARLPLPGIDVAKLGVEVAEALDYAHRRGVAHGALHSGNVLLSDQGAKVADFGLASGVLSLRSPPRQSDDLVQFGHLLRTALTGESGRPSQPPPDVPAGMARIVTGLIAGAYKDARTAMTDLQAIAQTAAPHAPKPASRRAAFVAAIAGLCVVAATGATLMGSRRAHPKAPTPTPTRITGTPYGTKVGDFDPPPGDGTEGRPTVAKAVDGDARTFWSTENYQSSARFSGKKLGVGIVLNIRSPQSVGKLRVQFVAPGCSYELRYSTTRSPTLDGWEIAVPARRAGTADGVVFPVRRSRWWLLWITGLTRGVPGKDGYACGVSEVALYPPNP